MSALYLGGGVLGVIGLLGLFMLSLIWLSLLK